jgi:hypothetical protein
MLNAFFLIQIPKFLEFLKKHVMLFNKYTQVNLEKSLMKVKTYQAPTEEGQDSY